MLSQSEMLARLGARRPNYSLDRDLYCDEGVFQLDLEHVFYKEWLFAIPSCDLPKPGAFATLQVGAYPVVITRANDGQIRAFHNVCRHRGQRLCAKETGQSWFAPITSGPMKPMAAFFGRVTWPQISIRPSMV